MNRSRRVISACASAVVVAAALPSPAVFAAAVAVSPTRAAVTPAPALGGVCLPVVLTCDSGGGTATSELPSSGLIAIGLVPPLLLGVVWRRRRRSM
jgi:hypothetical protein